MIPRYPNIESLKASLELQGLNVSNAESTSSKIVTSPSAVNSTAQVYTLDPVTKIANPQPKNARWQRIPRVGKRKRPGGK